MISLIVVKFDVPACAAATALQTGGYWLPRIRELGGGVRIDTPSGQASALTFYEPANFLRCGEDYRRAIPYHASVDDGRRTLGRAIIA